MNICFKRKIKHLVKDIQRDKVSGKQKAQEFFAEKGVYLSNISLLFNILRLDQNRVNRFLRLCKSIGKAAKKRDCFVTTAHLIQSVYRENDDARKIPFYKLFVVSEKQIHEKLLLVKEKPTGGIFDSWCIDRRIKNLTNTTTETDSPFFKE